MWIRMFLVLVAIGILTACAEPTTQPGKLNGCCGSDSYGNPYTTVECSAYYGVTC